MSEASDNIKLFVVKEEDKILLFGQEPTRNEAVGAYCSITGAIVLRGPQKFIFQELLGDKSSCEIVIPSLMVSTQ